MASGNGAETASAGIIAVRSVKRHTQASTMAKKKTTRRKTVKKKAVKKTSEKRIGTGLPGPGRPKGVRNKATIEAKEACAKIVDNEVYRERLRERALSGKLPPAIEVMLWHYAKGKPKDVVEVSSRGEVTHRVHGDVNEALGKYAPILDFLAKGSASGSAEDVRSGKSVDSETTD